MLHAIEGYVAEDTLRVTVMNVITIHVLGNIPTTIIRRQWVHCGQNKR